MMDFGRCTVAEFALQVFSQKFKSQSGILPEPSSPDLAYLLE